MDISKVTTKEKREFLAKLQSGKFVLKADHIKQEPKSFDLLDNGLYRCKQTGESLTYDELESLSASYDFCLEIVDKTAQVAGIERADSYECFNINYGDEKALERLLIPKE